MAEKKDKPKDTRTAEQIRRDIAAARARVSANVEQLVEEVHPTSIKDRAVGQARTFAQAEFNSAKATIKDEAGWRLDRVLAVGAAVAGVVAFLLTVRAIGGARQKSIARKASRELTVR
ncbi:DUF3618 domain-containing protein [Tessaracoccus sp. SD287]|uniref:DUF3618 domain-containing protein n=1 Tax=Tessaracoccus sp. SD287 TaxID=2782008 RepID=UPI001A97ADED|nr:DUF3618 domain-containing protein [Tessaracoccus sp. SD287]MBO1030408.1 DUF3618 domain-containing protein [Tessaracoccus sp. SD287]